MKESDHSLFGTLHDEAHARIIWGDSARDVAQWLVENGLTLEQAKTLVKASQKERSAEIRITGVSAIWWGVLMIVAGVVPILVMVFWSHLVFMKIAAALLLLALYGCYRVLDGLGRLISGRAGGSLTELD